MASPGGGFHGAFRIASGRSLHAGLLVRERKFCDGPGSPTFPDRRFVGQRGRLPGDWSNKAVANLWDSLEELRLLPTERLSEPIEGNVQAVIKIDVRLWPQSLANFIPGHNVARSLKEQCEQP